MNKTIHYNKVYELLPRPCHIYKINILRYNNCVLDLYLNYFFYLAVDGFKMKIHCDQIELFLEYFYLLDSPDEKVRSLGIKRLQNV